MIIHINDTAYKVAEPDGNLASILKTESLYQDRGIAVAVNNEILPKQVWENYQVQNNDNILIITATQGG